MCTYNLCVQGVLLLSLAGTCPVVHVQIVALNDAVCYDGVCWLCLEEIYLTYFVALIF